MPHLNDLTVLAMAAEGTAGTAETLADADYNVRVRNITLKHITEMHDEDSKFSTGDHGEDNAIAGNQTAVVEGDIRCCWGGAAGTAPTWWKFPMICGASNVSFTTTGEALEPLKAYDAKTGTIVIQEPDLSGSAQQTTLAGCVGNMVISADAVGAPIMAHFTITGKVSSVTTVTSGDILALTSPDTTIAERFLDADVTLSGITTGNLVSSWSLDFGNEVQPLYDQSETTGIDYYTIVTRKPRLSINPLKQLPSAWDVQDYWRDMTEGTVSIDIGSAHHFLLTVPVAQILDAGTGTREGYQNWDLVYKCERNGTTSATINDEATWQILNGATS